jgi:hypothetical protein
LPVADFGSGTCSLRTRGALNEVLCKIIYHNICCLIQESHELGIDTAFWFERETILQLQPHKNQLKISASCAKPYKGEGSHTERVMTVQPRETPVL